MKYAPDAMNMKWIQCLKVNEAEKRCHTGCLESELDMKNTPSPNPLFFQKISDSACIEPYIEQNIS
jgi:hypothetical protein